jgi:pimeloyl-ACP methyl ester carboxylesterase
MPGVEHRYVEARGLRVHVAEAGGGPPLVLQHGWPQHWYAWRPLIPAPVQRFRVICPDMRGFGWTDAPTGGSDKEGLAQDLLAVCDALGLERFALAGHDWGGFVAFVAAIRAPQRVERLVTMNTGHGFLKPDLRLLRALLGFWYMPIIGSPGVGAVLVRRGRIVRAIVRWGHPYKRERLTVPTLILHGTADRIVRPDFLRGWEGFVDDLRLEWLDGVGHFLQDAEAERVAQRMLAFLDAASG